MSGGPPWPPRPSPGIWEGGHCLANVANKATVRPTFNAVFLSLANDISTPARRITVEMTPGECLGLIENLRSAVCIAIASETASQG